MTNTAEQIACQTHLAGENELKGCFGNHDNQVADSSLNWHEIVSHQPSTNQSHYHCYKSCRQEVGCYPSDVTVDELAGYLDELLHLPKPMSDMAELMYT